MGPENQAPTQEPVEEDETLAPKTYTFNPLQANKELQIGDYYFKEEEFPRGGEALHRSYALESEFCGCVSAAGPSGRKAAR